MSRPSPLSLLSALTNWKPRTAFNASLVLVSQVLILSQVRQLALRTDFVPETGSLLKHLEMAMETIEVLAAGNRIANRCRLFLKNLMRYVAPLAASSHLLQDPTLQQSEPTEAEPPYHTSPFRSQLGEFMLESDFTYLNSILPPLAMDMATLDGFGTGAGGVMDGGEEVGLGAHGGYGVGFSG